MKWTCASLTFNPNGVGSQLKFKFDVEPNKTNAPLNITGDLVFNGAPLVVVDPANVIPGSTYPLLVVGGAVVPTNVPSLDFQGLNALVSGLS
jgi:hypothetical protein